MFGLHADGGGEKRRIIKLMIEPKNWNPYIKKHTVKKKINLKGSFFSY